MKELPPTTEGAEHRANGKKIIPHRESCPNSQNCQHWHHTPGTETAECAYCYQTFDRETMAAIFAGRAS